ncbi:MAG: hypothetical protein QM765_40735 [Myxococcales bacterium]
MITFADAAAEILAPWATPAQVRAAARALGEDAELDFGALSAAKKSKLIHQLVHQLSHLAVDQSVELHRQLQVMLEAEPRGEWRTDLASESALVELRNHLRQVLVVKGVEWERLYRLQAGVVTLARWLRGSPPASAVVSASEKKVSVELAASTRRATEGGVASSPFLLSLQPHVRDLTVTARGEEIVVAFDI